jgi:hypothetical protein
MKRTNRDSSVGTEDKRIKFLAQVESDDESDQEVANEVSAYLKMPSNPFFQEDRLREYLTKMESSGSGNQIHTSVNSLKNYDTRIRSSGDYRGSYVQFYYKRPLCVGLVTNAFGLMVNDAQNYREKLTFTSLKQLKHNHRVNLLLPVAQEWIHAPSRSLMIAFFYRIVEDIRAYKDSGPFQEACQEYNIDPAESMKRMRTKYITGVVSGKSGPSVFGVKVYTNVNRLNGPINAEINRISADGKIFQDNWESLVKGQFLHALVVLKCGGFKITQNGLFFDIDLRGITYEPIGRNEPTFNVEKNLFPNVEPSTSNSGVGGDGTEDTDPNAYENSQFSDFNF